MSLSATCRAGSAGTRLLQPASSLRCRLATRTTTTLGHHHYRRAYSQHHATPHSSSFYSHEHPPLSSGAAPGPSSFGRTEAAILAAAYAHVPEHGFTHRALSLGARDAGLLDVSPSALVDGPFSLIRWHLLTQRGMIEVRARELGFGVEGETPVGGVGARVAALTWARLMGNKDIIHRWQEALAIMAQPSYVPASLKELALLADEIWRLAGDTAVDPSWYTKRASLSAVYTATELFMTNDRSPDFAETHDFLRRRLNEVQSAGTTFGAVGQWVGFTASAGVNILRSKGVPV